MRTTHVNGRRLVELLGKSQIPDPPRGGWRAEEFAVHGRQIVRTIARVARYSQRRNQGAMAKKIQAALNAQVDALIRLVLGKAAAIQGTKADDPNTIRLLFPQSETIWAAAIQQVFQENVDKFAGEVMAPVQGTMAQAMSRVGVIVGASWDQSAINAIVSSEAPALARRVVQINSTTRNVLDRVVRNSINDGMTVYETAVRIKENLPGLNQFRSLTIARTELNRAWTQGTVRSLQGTNTITHVSVIGCEEREPSSPTFRGVSTCNISNVPIGEADRLEFHINHTGNMIPSNFRNLDGSVTDPGPVF